MEAVAPHAVPFQPSIRDGVPSRHVRKGRVECRVEGCDVRDIAESPAGCPDRGDGAWVVERREVRDAVEDGEDVVVDPRRFGETVAAMHDPVADGMHGVGPDTLPPERGNHILDGLSDRFRRVTSPPLDRAFEPWLDRREVKDGRLERGRARVQDEDATLGHERPVSTARSNRGSRGDPRRARGRSPERPGARRPDPAAATRPSSPASAPDRWRRWPGDIDRDRCA